MSQLLIQQYLNDLADLRRVSGTNRESVVREAFKTLLRNAGRAHELIFVAEYEFETAAHERRYVDGALLADLRVPFGYLESKDERDDLDDEIAIKFRRGYPQDNIIFEDSRTAALIQNRKEVMRGALRRKLRKKSSTISQAQNSTQLCLRRSRQIRATVGSTRELPNLKR